MKKIIYAVLCALLVISPFAVTFYRAAVEIPPQYDGTFLGEFAEKHERLKSTDDPKIILIGGSNLAFGVDSEKLAEYVGMPVVNYGLYASLGTKALLDMSEPHIKEGDIVVICPETNAQTYSLYYNGESMWQALDGDMSMIYDAGIDNFPKLVSTLPDFAGAKNSFYKSGNKPKASGIYSKDSFNEYGDISVERKYNEMPGNYDSTTLINISTEIIEDGFVDYLNDYAAKAERRGAQVFFSFSPMNASAVVSTKEQKREFYMTLGESLDFPIISDIDKYILSPAYFYDTNFHLNTRGAQLRTALLADDILRETGVTEYVETVKLSAPKRPDNYFKDKIAEEDKNSMYFTYSKVEGGLSISGLTAIGKQQNELTLPVSSDGQPVISVGAEVFAQAKNLKKIVIPENTSVRNISNRAFAGAQKLAGIEIYALPDKLTVGSLVFDGMNSSCNVYVPAENYGVFASDYFWSGLMKYIKQIEQ
ncbi:MAG: hypothetical protein IKV97_06495 [Clostridia bacterium]|nr:hypothetical protein [Clostridia bacterium]